MGGGGEIGMECLWCGSNIEGDTPTVPLLAVWIRYRLILIDTD